MFLRSCPLPRCRLRIPLLAISVEFLLVFAATGHSGESWPQFRGPDGQGHSDATDLPADWDNPENILWKTSIPGRGWSSPVVMDGQVWLTTALETEGSAELRKRQLEGDTFADSKDVVQSVSLHAIGIDLHTGTVLHDLVLVDIDEPVPIHSLNSYASPTPVLAPERLYCDFGRMGTFCVDVNRGEVVWHQQLQQIHSVGPGSSPLLVDGLLILTCDGLVEQFVAALDTATGEMVWRTSRPPMSGDDGELHKAFSTPILVGSAAGQQLFVPGAQWAAAYEPRTGKEIWRMQHGEGFSLVPRPVAAGGIVYMYTGFAGKGLLAIRIDGHGVVTDSHVVWNQNGVASMRPSPLLINGRIYTVTESGVASCVNAETSEIVWRKRLGGNFSASLLFAANQIYACSEEGVVTVFQTGDEYQELEKHYLEERIMASPAVVGESILLRTGDYLYRIGRAS
jgi:outer membrane protein assembly factor BamB